MPPGHEYPIAQQPLEADTTPTEKASWVHRHPYVAGTIVIIALGIIGVSIVVTRTGVQGDQSSGNWVGTGSIFSGGRQETTAAARLQAQEAVKQQSQETELGYIPVTINTGGGEEQSFGNDLTELLAQLVQPQGTSTGVSMDTSSAFSFIPQGLISTKTPGKKLTPEEEALRTYGNEIGTLVQGFETSHGNSPQILKDHAEDRGNAEKAARVDQLGYQMAELGRDLGQVQAVPASIAAAHAAFATTYRQVGTNLTKIAATKSDEELIDAINTYNASVESLSKRLSVLIGVFSANNVTFSSDEPGSVFMFNPTFSF